MRIDTINACLGRLKFTGHAVKEMIVEELGEITEDEVKQVLRAGEIIEQYPEDRPTPSCLIFGRTEGGRPLHIVCAPVVEEETLVIITVYEPDPVKWVDYRRRVK